MVGILASERHSLPESVECNKLRTLNKYEQARGTHSLKSAVEGTNEDIKYKRHLSK
jgi:hypothetical protein